MEKFIEQWLAARFAPTGELVCMPGAAGPQVSAPPSEPADIARLAFEDCWVSTLNYVISLIEPSEGTQPLLDHLAERRDQGFPA